jgi:hypothetical protein
MNKLIKRLRREATKNPKKAAVLGLLTVVALYFWAPTVLGWVARREPAGMAINAVPADTATGGQPSPASANPPTGVPDKVAMTSWQTVVERMERDPRTRPSTRLGLGRDPFHSVPHRVVEQEEVERKTKSAQHRPTLASLGLRLTSTMVSRTMRLAIVNGRTYREGDLIDLGKERELVQLRLAGVFARRVLLEMQDQKFELAIPEPKHRGRLELSQGKVRGE